MTTPPLSPKPDGEGASSVNDDDLLLLSLTPYQTSFLKSTMDRAGRECTAAVFADAFLKAHNSVAMYKQKTAIERQLERVFAKYDYDKDGVLQFKDLPLQDILLGRDPRSEKKDLMLYSDWLVSLRWKTDAAEQKFGCVPDFADCSGVCVHASLNKYSVSWRNYLLLFDVDAENGLLLPFAKLAAHTSNVVKALYVPQLMAIFTSGADQVVWKWSEMDGWMAKERARLQSVQTCLAFVAASQQLLSGGCDGAVSVYHTDPKFQQPFRRITAHSERWVMDITVLAELDEFATCSSDGLLKMWSLSTFELKRANSVPGGVHLSAMAYSRKQRALYTVVAGRFVYVWSPFLPKPTEALRSHDKSVVGIQCFNSSPEVITADIGGKICIWDMRSTTVVQSIGGPDSPCPCHEIQSMAYDLETQSLVVLGDRMSLVVPQQGSNSALMEMPVQCIAYNQLEKHIYAASGGKVVIFDLPTGAVVAVRSFGGVEVTKLVLSPPHMLIGTLEGTVECVLLGSWKKTRSLVLEGEVKALSDIGSAHSMLHGLVSPSPKAAVVTSRGKVMYFCYSGDEERSTQPQREDAQEVFSTNVEEALLAVFSARHGMLYFACAEGVLQVWDLIVRSRKTQHHLPTSIVAMCSSDEAAAVFVSLQDGAIFGFHMGSGVGILKLFSSPKPFVSRILEFNAATWCLCMASSTRIATVSLERALRAVQDRRELASFPSFLDPFIVGEYEVDRAIRQPLLRAFYCRVEGANSREVFCALASQDPGEREVADRLRLLRKLKPNLQKASKDIQAADKCILFPIDVVIPSSREKIALEDTAYSIVPRFSVEQDPIRALYDAAASPRAVEEKVLSGLRWLVASVCTALAYLHEEHRVVSLMDSSTVRLVGSRFLIAFPRGVWKEGCVVVTEIPLHRTPPDGIGAGATASLDMWLVGLMLFSCMCGRPLFPEGKQPAPDFSIATTINVERDIAPPFRQAQLLLLLRKLLATDGSQRPSASEVLRMLACQAPPKHLSHIPLTQETHHQSLKEIPSLPQDQFVDQTLTVALRSSNPSAIMLADNPTLWIVGEYDGNSAHLVLWSRTSAKLLGITPPNNAVSTIYGAAQEEVTSTVTAEVVADVDDMDSDAAAVQLSSSSPAPSSPHSGKGAIRKSFVFGRSMDATAPLQAPHDHDTSRPQTRARSVMSMTRIGTPGTSFTEPLSHRLPQLGHSLDPNLRLKLTRLKVAKAFH